MTALDPEPTSEARGGGTPPGSSRRSVASVALAIAILAVAVLAVVVLVRGSSDDVTDDDVDAPTTSDTDIPPVEAAPPAPLESPDPVPASTPAPPPARPADGPAVADTTGAPLPGPVADGVRSAFTTLAAGNVDALQPVYVPSRTVRAAPWPTVAGLLRQPATRDGVLAALRAAPIKTPDGWRYATPTGNQVGIDPQGHIAYVRLA